MSMDPAEKSFRWMLVRYFLYFNLMMLGLVFVIESFVREKPPEPQTRLPYGNHPGLPGEGKFPWELSRSDTPIGIDLGSQENCLARLNREDREFPFPDTFQSIRTGGPEFQSLSFQRSEEGTQDLEYQYVIACKDGIYSKVIYTRPGGTKPLDREKFL